jgi:hypothetical protein
MVEGMPQDRSKLIGIGFGALLAGFAAFADYSAARAGDTDAEESTGDKILRTLGLRDLGSTEYELNYSERSPLVVPPNRNLPAPISTNGAPTPNWPNDPDIRASKEGKKSDKPSPGPDRVIDSSRPLRPDELNVGRNVAPPGTPEQTSPTELGEKKSFFSFDWLKKNDHATFTGEPPRVSLTDPPPGYQTPSPDQPYGLQPDVKGYKPKTLGERMEPVR